MHFFTAQQVTMATGVSARCLHYWDTTGVVSPSVKARGAGVYRGYARADVIIVSIVKRMREAGVSLQRIRKAIPAIRATVRQAQARGQSLRVRRHDGSVVIVLDGRPGAEQAQAIIDALRGGQLVLAIAVQSIRAEIEPKLSKPQWRPRGALSAAR